MVIETFEVTEEHIKLLRAAYVDWRECEFGAPAIDCKRPYGNSSVELDIADILGYEYDYEDEDIEELNSYLREVHYGTHQALQIFLKIGRMEPGVYECTRNFLGGSYISEWVKQNES
jgi:hypothetical protein